MRLTQAQRAQRRATRINNRLKRECPLFAGQLATTPEEQLAEIKRLDRKTEAYFARLEQLRQEMADRAAARRAEVAALVSPEELAALDRRRAIYPDSPSYAADFWRRVLLEINGPDSPSMEQ